MSAERPPVEKTYKLFVGGAFPRSESGRTYVPDGARGVHVCRSSKKDLRDAVGAARKGLADWAKRSGYNRGQIVFRVAEMLETRKGALADELCVCGAAASRDAALAEVEAAVDLCAWYAGIPDKLNTLLGAQNDVAGPFFAFSTVEPVGVVGILAPERPALVGMLALLLPVWVGGNAAIVLASEAAPLPGLAFGEVCASSDVPAGSINVLSGSRDELALQFAAHRDIDGLLVAGEPDSALGAAAADSVKRVRYAADLADAPRRLDWIEPFVDVKTLWHPVAW